MLLSHEFLQVCTSINHACLALQIGKFCGKSTDAVFPCVQSREVARAGVSRVGRMEIGPEILGYGSSGTLVFEGTLHGRPIAVKRILSQVFPLYTASSDLYYKNQVHLRCHARPAAEHHLVPHFMAKVLRMHYPVQFYELARKEIGALILSDEHPNIVRCFAMEEDNEFVYLALERCRQSLNDLVNSEDGPANFLDDARRPTPFCMQAMLPSPTPMLSDPCGNEGNVFKEDESLVHKTFKSSLWKARFL